MPNIYMSFDFSTDEEKAQLARHKLEVWKQAFRLDKKLLYKFERKAEAGKSETAEAEAGEKSKAKSKAKEKEKAEAAAPKEHVKLLVRLGFSNHEKISGERWVTRIPTEDPFKAAHPAVVKPGDSKFEEVEQQFETLA